MSGVLSPGRECQHSSLVTGLRLTCLLDNGFTERLTHDIGVRKEGDAGLLSRMKEVGSGEIEISSRVPDPLLFRCRRAVKAEKSRWDCDAVNALNFETILNVLTRGKSLGVGH